MSNVVVLMHLTLNGVMQAPGRPDEDRRGGWARPRGDSVAAAIGGIGEVGNMLFGRRTYEDFFPFWPNQGDIVSNDRYVSPFTGCGAFAVNSR